MSMILFHFSLLSPLGKGHIPSLVENDFAIFEKKIKIWEVNNMTDGRTDDGQHMIRKTHICLKLRLAKNACYLTTSCLIFSGTILFTWIWSELRSIFKTTNLYNPTGNTCSPSLVWSYLKTLCRYGVKTNDEVRIGFLVWLNVKVLCR